MIAIVAMLAACIVVLRGWPGLPLARTLDGWLVTPLARRDAALTTGHWLLFLIVAAGVGTAFWMGGDMIVVMGLASPEIVVALGTIEFAAYIDAALAVAAAAGVVRGVPVRLWFRRTVGRTGRARRTRAVRKAANDDGDGPPRFALAA